MGGKVAPVVAARFGRRILELGGNNAAIIVTPSADIDLVGARRHLLRRRHRGPALHHACAAHRAPVAPRRGVRPIGHVGVRQPAHRRPAASRHAGRPADQRCGVRPDARRSQRRGPTAAPSSRVGGERVGRRSSPAAAYVRRPIVAMPARPTSCATETFAPILYVMAYDTSTRRSRLQNDVPQGLASSIFTTDMREAERSCRAAAATAASPTSTSAPAAPRSAAPSVARRRPAAAASRAATPGRATCGARPTRSTTPTRCRSRKGSSSSRAAAVSKPCCPRWLRRPRRGRLETVLSPVVEEAARRPSRNRAVPGG
jgi:aldehyde dehydrogenase (NAD+)